MCCVHRLKPQTGADVQREKFRYHLAADLKRVVIAARGHSYN